ncbi:MAG: CoA transferase, partial [Bauldia sp.]
DPHLEAAGFFHEMDHPSEGKIRLVGIPSRWSRTPPAITRHPPQIGEQSREILMEAGFAADEIERLIADGAVCVPQLKQAAE